MQKFAEWLTARPARGFLTATASSALSLLALPVAAWLPAAVPVLVLLAAGPRPAALAAVGAALPVAWAFSPVLGAVGALSLAAVVLGPAYLAGVLLNRSRSLNLVFQVAALSAAALVLVLHVTIGHPSTVLLPLPEAMRPMLEEAAAALVAMGVPSTPEQVGVAAARVAWATSTSLLLLHTMLALFLALWAFGTVREPGLFGRQFRALRLGNFVAWIALAALAVNLAAKLATGRPWQPAEDVLFVLASAFLLQALAVAHALRNAQVLGTAPLVLCYVAAVLLPMALVGVGLADTWMRFRERFGGARPRAGA